ncbi:hypothetical protein BTS2_2689 [Bacillus sp. TS-2]|nr:hypothetical protein BTS2_2689 [Bacillus sp. TS-2]
MAGAFIGLILLLAYHWLADPTVSVQSTVMTGIIATALIAVISMIYVFVKNKKGSE